MTENNMGTGGERAMILGAVALGVVGLSLTILWEVYGFAPIFIMLLAFLGAYPITK